MFGWQPNSRPTDTSVLGEEMEGEQMRRGNDEGLRCCLVTNGLDSNEGHRHTPSQPDNRRDKAARGTTIPHSPHLY